MTEQFNTYYNRLKGLFGKTILESSLSRIWPNTQKYSCGTITAFRGDKTYSQNIQNNKKIVAYLLSKGYSVTSVTGTYIENFKDAKQKEEEARLIAAGEKVDSLPERPVSERSFFVANQNVEGDDNGQLEKDLFDLGKLFDQDSVLIIPFGGKDAYLLGTSRREGIISRL
jgi:hypothetical protein